MFLLEKCSRKSHNSNLSRERAGLMLIDCIHVFTLLLERHTDNFVLLVLIANLFISGGGVILHVILNFT